MRQQRSRARSVTVFPRPVAVGDAMRPVFISIKKSNDENADGRIEKGPPEKFPTGERCAGEVWEIKLRENARRFFSALCAASLPGKRVRARGKQALNNAFLSPEKSMYYPLGRGVSSTLPLNCYRPSCTRRMMVFYRLLALRDGDVCG